MALPPLNLQLVYEDGRPRRVSDAITALASDPRPPGAKKLVASAVWRIRIGDYRDL